MDHNQKPGAPAQMPPAYHPPAVKPLEPAAAAELVKAFALKPGYQTSEFWLSSLVACLPAITTHVPAWVSAVAAAAYALSRGIAKLRK